MSIDHEDEDRTLVGSSHSTPPAPAPGGGHGAPGEEDTHALPNGTRLNEFELLRRIGEGGFSIVYLARDHSLERNVALKEYMPGTLASRFGGTQIRPRSERHRETFEAGLKSFINEARLLASFDHPALVKVYRFWEANGTAYLVMPLYDGVTLKDGVQAMQRPPDEAWLLDLLAPLTDALQVIHGEHCYHRDIAPDNIMLLADGGKPLLLDFGAARRVIGDMTQALTVILKPGYAPVEQYAEVPGMKQGPWTDVYALAATVYWAMTGKRPPPAVGRMWRDSYESLVQVAAGHYSERFLRAIDSALVVLPEQRTQTIAALRTDLGLDSRVAGTLDGSRTRDPDATVIRPVPAAAPPPVREARAGAEPPVGTAIRKGSPANAVLRRRMLGIAVPVLVLLLAGFWWVFKPNRPATLAPHAPAAAPSQPASHVVPTPAPTSPAPAADQASARPLPPPGVPPSSSPPPKAAPSVASHPEGTRVRGRSRPASAPETTRARDALPQNAECAQIFQRLSLGEDSAALMNRAKAMGCR